MPDLRHFEWRALHGILFSLDHEPAFIAMGGQTVHDRLEIERPVASYRERAFDDGIQKTLPGAIEPVDNISANVLGVDVGDAGVMLVDHPQHVTAGEGHMAGAGTQR